MKSRHATGGRRQCALWMQGVMVCLWLWTSPTFSAVAEAENGTINPSPGGVVHSLELSYRELDAPIMQWGLRVTDRPSAFQKEPESKGDKIIRGTLSFYDKAEYEVPFLWVKGKGRLYLDLNRNQDLTDDVPGGLLCAEDERVRSLTQTFTNIHFAFKTSMGTHPVLADLALYSYAGNQVFGNLGWRSLWEGRVSLQGRDWQVGFAESTSGRPGSTESSYLLLRRWEARDEAFRLNEGSLEAFAFPKNLFLGKQQYELICTYFQKEDAPRYKLELAEQPSELGELRLSGNYIHRLLLSSPKRTVLLVTPEPVVHIPLGSYNHLQAALRQGGTEAYLQGDRFGRSMAGTQIQVTANKPATLRAGGPLTNTVAITQRGRTLNLSYQLVGADGEPYQLQGARTQPSFTIHQGNKEIASGKFEFG